MKKYLLILASLMSLSHSLVHCKDDRETNLQNVGIVTVVGAAGLGAIYYCFGDKIKSYCYGSPVTTTETPAMNSTVTYEPELQKALSKDSARDESAPIIITEHKAHEELKDILHKPENSTTQQVYSALVTATENIKKTLETTKEIFKNKTASEVFTKYPMD